MSVRELTLSPAGQKGFGMFLTRPDDKSARIYAFTQDYVKYVLIRQNMEMATKLQLDYQPQTSNQLHTVSWTHAVYLAQGWESREPHMVEVVDDFYDFKSNETELSRAVVDIKKRFNIVFGSLLDPPYPELLPVFRLPLPTSPFA
jgi:hypothetical protein